MAPLLSPGMFRENYSVTPAYCTILRTRTAYSSTRYLSYSCKLQGAILCISVIARPAFRPALAPRVLRVRGQRWQGRGDRSVINRRTEINIEKCALVAKLRA